MMPSTSPGSREKDMPLRTGLVLTRGDEADAVDDQLAFGPGQLHALAAAHCGRSSKVRMRRKAAMAKTHWRQPSISCSNGIRARPIMMLAAMMLPGEASRSITSVTPAARSWRSAAPGGCDLEVAASALAPCFLAQQVDHVRTGFAPALGDAPNMPIASITSALRTRELASPKERAAASLASASGRRVSTSVSDAQQEQDQAGAQRQPP